MCRWRVAEAPVEGSRVCGAAALALEVFGSHRGKHGLSLLLPERDPVPRVLARRRLRRVLDLMALRRGV